MTLVDSYIHRLHLSIDHALAVSYRKNMYDGKTAFVAHITLVKGTPFYGYTVGYKLFLKIYLLNPLHMTRLADLLRQGTVMKRAIQPYESHMQYILQWMCDYNLYGCSYLDCSKVVFRSPVPAYLEMSGRSHQWHDRTIPKSGISDELKLPRQSHCSIEVDICVQDILNRLDTKERSLHHNFIEHTNPLALDEKLVHSMAGLWRDETRRRKARMGDKDPKSSPFPPEVLVSVSADPRATQKDCWIHSEEYAKKMLAVANQEKEQSDGRPIDFQDFVQTNHLEQRVKTAFESIEDLFPSNLPQIFASQKEHERISFGSLRHEDLEVDESRILAINQDNMAYAYLTDEEIEQELHILQGMNNDKIDTHTNGHDLHGSHEDWVDHTEFEGDPTRASQHDLVPGEGINPNSSAELESLGIRDQGDYDYIQQDAFEISSEYTSDISSAVARHKRARLLASVAERPVKRERFNHGENSSIMDTPLATSSVRPESIMGHVLAPAWDARGSPSFLPVALSGDACSDHDQVKGISRSVQQSSKDLKSSQSANELARNGRLHFPVVKDPHSPYTIQKLSQRNNSSVQVSQTVSGKHVSFDASPGITSNKYSAKPGSNGTSTSVAVSPTQLSKRSSRLYDVFPHSVSERMFQLESVPPAKSEVSSTKEYIDMPSVIYQEAYYANEQDVPERPREYAGREFRLGSATVPYLPDFGASSKLPPSLGEMPGVVIDRAAEDKAYLQYRRMCTLSTWEICEAPPKKWEVTQWLASSVLQGEAGSRGAHILESGNLSQVHGPTQKNKYGFKYSQNQPSTSVQHEMHYMSLMSLEIHVNTRGNLVPNPEQDEISCVFWCLQSDEEGNDTNNGHEGTHVGILALSESGGLAHKISKQAAVEVEEEPNELDLIIRLVNIVRNHDPDILTGFEVHGGSWGYMIERARRVYDYNLCDEFSRMKSQSHGRFGKDNDKWGFNNTSTIRITGRHMINIWRAMRGELNLLQYTMENIVFHLLNRRIPHYAFADLTRWYNSSKSRDFARVIDYYMSRVQLDLKILEQNELVPRTSEQARLLGVDFFSVFSRGSQFKVESLMFRIAKPENFILVSPSRKQVGQQNALECLPLVMEPQSGFYTSPLLVLDFQSLYPSVMIAYNYCYSTFLGRVVNWRGQNKMGFTDFERQARLLELLKDHINIAPNGMMYVKPQIRKSLLAKMLGEILETRVMVKSGMKIDKDDKTLQRLLNNRQLALKLIANVTYGYTSASFSGRMPCSEIADSIVQTARETLEKAIALIHSVERWGAEVVYGDTDSLFVYLKGRTKDEAFDIGSEIVKQITDMNPRPIKLKFEKVYLPCVLLAKKRYVGFKYESRTQKEPDFDAKGIETVRRDGTPAEQKIEENALKILFRTADLSQVKAYFQHQCMKIMRGKVSIQDFCFAKEVKLGIYSDKGPPPPGALISTRRMLEDPRAEPQYGERVPYVVITGAPGARLIDRCVAPEVLLRNDHNELDAEYYISKNLIPPLERIFNLVGANVRHWYDEMPKYQRIRRVDGLVPPDGKDFGFAKKTLESYMKASACLVCSQKLDAELPICSDCSQRPATSLLKLRSDLNNAETKEFNLERVCRSCAALPFGDAVRCDSKDCPVFYTRTRHKAVLGSTKAVTLPVLKILEGAAESALDW